MNYHIEELNNINAIDWKRLCEEEGSFFHSLEWKQIIEQSFNFISHYFLLYRNEELVALCPFYEAAINGIRGLVPLPHSDYHYIIITDKSDSLIIDHIIDKCKEIARKNKLFFILITTFNELAKDHINRYKTIPYPIGGNMVLNLEDLSPDKIWNDIFSTEIRKYIRRFEKDGFTINEVNSIEEVRIFYKYYKINLEYINATPYPFSHFEDLLKTYSSREMILTLLYKNENVAGGHLAFIYSPKKTIYSRYISLNRDLPSRYKPAIYLYWDFIKKASEKGDSIVNFGRTPPFPKDIHYQLKEKFGCQYEKEYSIIIPTSYLFKIVYPIYYNLYSLVKKYKHS